ncbi:MAG: FMN-binding protein [Micromonosporaceae bacterium]|nr:FMN-binding protein [Micromonosporaceae bacterium]
MRRGIATIIGTAVGTVLLIGAKYGTQTLDAANASAGAPAQQAVAGAGSTPTAAAGATKQSKATAKPAAPNPPASGLKDGTFTGAGGQEAYGTITVSVTVQNGRISKATGSCAGCQGLSVSITGGALPTLQQETLAKQSASIATVSGATQTSEGYRASLQSALDAAKA